MLQANYHYQLYVHNNVILSFGMYILNGGIGSQSGNVCGAGVSPSVIIIKLSPINCNSLFSTNIIIRPGIYKFAYG